MFWRKNFFLFESSFCLLCIMIFMSCFLLPICAEETGTGINSNHVVWISGNLPKGSTTKGKWEWDETLTHDEAKTHIQSAVDQISRHSFKGNNSIALDKGSSVVQYIYLDPKNTPSGVMLKFFIAPGEEIIFYWEGYEEVFAELDEYINAWYMGFMPDTGVWVKLIIDFKELDIPKAELLGIEFILSDGRVWWGKTLILNSSVN